MERPWVTSPSYEQAISALVEARRAMGLSQRALADRLGKPRSFISKIEGRERRIDIVEFIALARALEYPPAELLGAVERALTWPLAF
jgi:transcriptional regulator with XRE-family HTH domain